MEFSGNLSSFAKEHLEIIVTDPKIVGECIDDIFPWT